MSKPNYMRLAKFRKVGDEMIFQPNKSFGIHIYGTNKDVVEHLNNTGYVVLGSAQMVYVPQDRNETEYL